MPPSDGDFAEPEDAAAWYAAELRGGAPAGARSRGWTCCCSAWAPRGTWPRSSRSPRPCPVTRARWSPSATARSRRRPASASASPAINAAEEVWLLVSGEAKAPAVARALAGADAGGPARRGGARHPGHPLAARPGRRPARPRADPSPAASALLGVRRPDPRQELSDDRHDQRTALPPRPSRPAPRGRRRRAATSPPAGRRVPVARAVALLPRRAPAPSTGTWPRRLALRAPSSRPPARSGTQGHAPPGTAVHGGTVPLGSRGGTVTAMATIQTDGARPSHRHDRPPGERVRRRSTGTI